MTSSPRAARSATVAPTSGATTVTTAPDSSSPRIADRAAAPPPQTSTGRPSSSRLAEKPDGGWICMAARGYHCCPDCLEARHQLEREAARFPAWFHEEDGFPEEEMMSNWIF